MNNCGNSDRRALFVQVAGLSLPSMWAQVSSVVMQYIDAAMLGHLSADATAAVGVVASATWLFGGLCSALTTGFTVQVAQASGGGALERARGIMRHGLWAAFSAGLCMALLGLWLSVRLPVWLGAEASIHGSAARYFQIYAVSLPFVQLNGYAAGMLQSSGNMRVPGLLTALMYGMDVLFNYLLIFPTRQLDVLGWSMAVPGMGLGVEGAALGTALAQGITGVLMLCILLFREPDMRLRRGEPFFAHGLGGILRQAFRLGSPIALEQVVMRFAQTTVIGMIAPLGNAAMAAHSLAITAENFAFMPAYGIGLAQTAITGREIGAGDRKRAKAMGWAGMGFAAAITVPLSVILFLFAPQLMSMLTPDPELILLGTRILRIEAFAELMYGTQLVCAGILQGRGDTLVSSTLMLGSLWLVRVPLTALLIGPMGLAGAWLAMCIELNVRGILFLLRFQFSRR